MKTIASEVYKIVNDLSPSYIQDLVPVKVSNYDYNCGAKSEKYSVRDQVISFWGRPDMEQFAEWDQTCLVLSSVPEAVATWDSLGCGCPVCAD